MKKLLIAVLVVTLLPLPALAQSPPPPGSAAAMLYEPPPTHKRRSPTLATIGGVVLGSGIATALLSLPSAPGDDYLINDQFYCVNIDLDRNYFDVERDPCREVSGIPELRPYAYAMMGAGVLMLVLGLQKVQIRPMLAPGVTGAAATIRW